MGTGDVNSGLHDCTAVVGGMEGMGGGFADRAISPALHITISLKLCLDFVIPMHVVCVYVCVCVHMHACEQACAAVHR